MYEIIKKNNSATLYQALAQKKKMDNKIFKLTIFTKFIVLQLVYRK